MDTLMRITDHLTTSPGIQLKIDKRWCASVTFVTRSIAHVRIFDAAGPLNDALETAWKLAGGQGGPPQRTLEEGALDGVSAEANVPPSDNPATEAARRAIMETIRQSCGVKLSEAIEVQARHSADFTVSSFCKEGSIGTECRRTMMV